MLRAHVDAGQAAVVQALRNLGAVVTPTHRVGQGFPDLVISWRGRWHVMELKTGAQRLNARQSKWHQAQRAPVLVARGPYEAVQQLLTATREDA